MESSAAQPVQSFTPLAAKAGQPHNVIINAGSGGALKLGRARLDALAAQTGLAIDQFDIVPSEDFTARLQVLAKADKPLLVGGGDGTFAHAAAVHMKLDKPFGILPMGTMNLLGKDLGVPSILEEPNLFDLYCRTRIQLIDVGMANDHQFLCCAAIGTIPEASVFRENFRHVPNVIMVPRLTAFVMNQMDIEHIRSLQILADDREMSLQTAALVVSNNCFAPSAEASHPLAKNSLQEGMLGLYSASPQSFFERIRLLLNLQQGKLEIEPSVQEMQATNIHVKTGNEKELVSVDGEPILMDTPINFRILNGALKMIVPVRETKPIE
jgi:diacylglycerol kinase family enzyme